MSIRTRLCLERARLARRGGLRPINMNRRFPASPCYVSKAMPRIRNLATGHKSISTPLLSSRAPSPSITPPLAMPERRWCTRLMLSKERKAVLSEYMISSYTRGCDGCGNTIVRVALLDLRLDEKIIRVTRERYARRKIGTRGNGIRGRNTNTQKTVEA